jgi:YesN/AraC family two-component response regulator
MLSCYSSLNNVKEAINCGAKGFIVKPFGHQKIIDALEHFNKQRAA